MEKFKNFILVNNVLGNIFGGITAAIVAIPLALAFGVSSGAGATAGLYSAIITGFFASLFGGTKTQITGPTGPMTVIMTVIISTYIDRYGTNLGLSYSFTIVMLAGIFQFVFGTLKFGGYISLVPYPVISAFMSGIGLLIIVLQIPIIFGVPENGDALHIVSNIFIFMKNINVECFLLGGAALIITYIIPLKVSKYIPSTLISLISVTVISKYINDGTLELVGSIPAELPSIILPKVTYSETYNILKYAVILASLGSIDSLLTSIVADNITKTEHDSNKELRGQGIGNIISGMFGGLPGAGATMRTMVNISSGGTNRLSGVIHSVVLLLLLLGLNTTVENIPHTVLSGLLIRVGIDIIDWKILRYIPHMNKAKSATICIVIIMTVFFDLLMAVGFGVFAFSILTIKNLADQQIESMKILNSNSTNLFTNSDSNLFSSIMEHIEYIHFSGPLSFGATRSMIKVVSAKSDIKVIDLMDVTFMDLSSAFVLLELIDSQVVSGCKMIFISSDKLFNFSSCKTINLFEKVPRQNIFNSREEALKFISINLVGCKG